MSEDSEKDEGIEGEHYVKVPMAYYNSLFHAADLGFETLVQRRNALQDLARRIPQYPERNSANMEAAALGVIDGVPLQHEDVNALVRIYSQRISRLAEALNHRLHSKRYS